MKAFAEPERHSLRCSVMKKLVHCLSLLLLSAVPLLYAQSGAAPAAKIDPLTPTLGVKSAAEIDRQWQQSVAKYDAQRNRLLAEAERQRNDGPYRPDWATLGDYQPP